MGHNDHVHMQLRDAVNSGMILGPRMKAAGVAVLMSWGHAYFMCQQVHTVDEAVAEIRRQVTFGADFIKLIASNDDVWQYKGDGSRRPLVRSQRSKGLCRRRPMNAG